MISISEIDLNFIKHYLRIEEEFIDDDNEITMFWNVAEQYLKSVCDLTEEEYLNADTLVPALLLLISEMYLERSAVISSNTKANPLIDRYINTKRKFL